MAGRTVGRSIPEQRTEKTTNVTVREPITVARDYGVRRGRDIYDDGEIHEANGTKRINERERDTNTKCVLTVRRAGSAAD